MEHPSRSSSGWLVAADIGGTFTDVIALGPDARIVPVKTLSTPPDFGTGVLDGAVDALRLAEAEPTDVTGVLHATTVATNAILERRGAKTAVVTTAGFRDVLEIGRLRRPALYDLSWRKPEPLARRRDRHELAQRISADGSVPIPVDEGELRRLARQLSGDGIEAVAVCLVNSPLVPDEERAVADALRALLPGVYVSASVDISPEMGEFERTSTAVVNSYVGPVVHSYVTDLGAGLRRRGISAPFSIMQSSGGLLDARSVAGKPVQIIESGPAAGVIAVQKLARLLGLDNVVAFDMGGTTAKASLIEHGRPFVAGDYEVGGGMNRTRAMGKGAGYTIRVPSIDIAEVGAGGGSVITVDTAGAVHVGPQSAGSRPGPACYGQGGDSPTLTDANVVLGYLNAEAIAGGRVAISPALARKALEPVAGEIGKDVLGAARGAYEIAVSNMTSAVKAVTSERGRDPRDSVMVAFGGAGPLYAAELARELGIGKVVVPVHTGLFSSLGLLVADTEYQAAAPYQPEMRDLAVLAGQFDVLREQVRAGLAPARTEAITFERSMDLRYRGQRFELRIPLPDGPVDERSLVATFARFHEEHLRTYGRASGDELVEVANLRMRGVVPNPVRIDRALALPPDEGRSPSSRVCRFATDVTTPVIRRTQLDAEPKPGPLVVEDMDSTTLVPPGARARLDTHHNIVITWNDSEVPE
ncbi:hydantoinase/oxoprolinase family protein [Amycolatopsis jiangsuensis]|uniref:N-methylhydantoinase A n=1 Tax=Amycolatopsis jiangsuensis TaxID=1181879 RepID=A0A840INP6_9PSEU|nr:hydantoinase/oxoprolinase family protein [Amycolatopsis jiangsuensis]MBB4684051.1 N-methylhydantoinase A [Amycolatopsis jiangsuensis]